MLQCAWQRTCQHHTLTFRNVSELRIKSMCEIGVGPTWRACRYTAQAALPFAQFERKPSYSAVALPCSTLTLVAGRWPTHSRDSRKCWAPLIDARSRLRPSLNTGDLSAFERQCQYSLLSRPLYLLSTLLRPLEIKTLRISFCHSYAHPVILIARIMTSVTTFALTFVFVSVEMLLDIHSKVSASRSCSCTVSHIG